MNVRATCHNYCWAHGTLFSKNPKEPELVQMVENFLLEDRIISAPLYYADRKAKMKALADLIPAAYQVPYCKGLLSGLSYLEHKQIEAKLAPLPGEVWKNRPKKNKKPKPTPVAAPKPKKAKKPKRSKKQRGPLPKDWTAAFIASKEFLHTYEWTSLRVEALLKYERVCVLCGASKADGFTMNVDHIKPRKHYPELCLDIDNLQILCAECNKGKCNDYDTDWRNL